ncbi:MAG: glycosyltransferase [Nitrospira sp.]|nr:glycosyltransferase [Nitrospira sp.]
MKVAAVTITLNRFELTKKTVDSFYSKTGVDYHLFVDNGSTDGTREWLKDYDHIQFEENKGIALAFATAVSKLEGYDYILKLDNDIETVTDDIISKMLDFHSKAGDNYVCSPVDLMIDPKFYPPVMSRIKIQGYDVEFVTHTGGAFQLIPYRICKMLCDEYRHLAKGDYAIGIYYRQKGYRPVYLKDLQMKHIGLNNGTPRETYKL